MSPGKMGQGGGDGLRKMRAAHPILPNLPRIANDVGVLVKLPADSADA